MARLLNPGKLAFVCLFVLVFNNEVKNNEFEN